MTLERYDYDERQVVTIGHADGMNVPYFADCDKCYSHINVYRAPTDEGKAQAYGVIWGEGWKSSDTGEGWLCPCCQGVKAYDVEYRAMQKMCRDDTLEGAA